MIYFDTSALVPMFFKEATSTAIESLIRGLPHHIATLSDWTRVEFSSFLAKEVRMGGLSSTEAQAIADEVMRYFKRAPKHARKQQAEWFSVARSYQKHTRAKPLG